MPVFKIVFTEAKMIDIKRKLPRFDISFQLSTNLIQGKGINISQTGLAFLTMEELIPADGIPFETTIKGFIFSEANYNIKGDGRLLYSKKSAKHPAYFHNGFEFVNLETDSKESLLALLNDLLLFSRDLKSGLINKTLADFYHYPANDIFIKTNLFFDTITKLKKSYYPMFLYQLNESNNSSTNISNIELKKEKNVIMFGSNNYLGLTSHPDVIAAGKKALEDYGSGSGAGAMVGGTFTIHKQLEEEIADFVGKEAVLLYNSGYSANIGIISGLMRPNDAIINDEYNHASIFDGCKLSGVKSFVFSHNSIASLERILKRTKLKYNGMLIVVDGVYSTSGKSAFLKEICRLANKYDCKLMVDEAHGFGVLGKKGIGACEHHDVIHRVDIIMATLSKSLASIGGFAAADKAVIEYLRFYSHSYFFSTGIPPAAVATTLKALQILREDRSVREQLWYNINFFKNGLQNLGLPIGNIESAIIPIYIPDIPLLLSISNAFFSRGLYHNIMMYPAVPLGGSLLRFGIMATHTKKELEKALNIIEEVINESGLIEQINKEPVYKE